MPNQVVNLGPGPSRLREVTSSLVVPTPLAPISWQEVEDALSSFFYSATGLSIIWADQKIPRPTYPYGTLKSISGPTPKAVDEQRTNDDETGTTCGDRDWTVQFKVYGRPNSINPTSHARFYQSAVVAAFEFNPLYQILSHAGLAVRKIMPITLPDEQVADAWISKSTVDVVFGLASNITVPISTIESVGPISGTLNPP